MRPLCLTLENVLSYRGTHEIPFAGLNLAVLSGLNGAGKSSIIDAIIFALFGDPRGSTIDSMITDGEDKCRAELLFELNGLEYLAVRTRTRGKKSVVSFCSPAEWDRKKHKPNFAQTSEEAQRRIVETLGMDHTLFRMTVCASQGDAAAFSTADPADRRRVLGDILGLKKWEMLAAVTRKKAASLQSDITAGVHEIKTIEEQCTGLEVHEIAIREADTRLDQLTADEGPHNLDLGTLRAQEADLIGKAAARQSMQDRSLDLTRQINNATTEKNRTAFELGEARKLIDAIPQMETDLANAQAAAEELKEVESLVQRRATLSQEVKTLEQKAARIRSEHRERVRVLTLEIQGEEKEHARDLTDARARVSNLQTQAALLEEVPCPTQAPDCADTCKLLASARLAAAGIEASIQVVQLLESQMPAIKKKEELAGLETQTPWAETDDQLSTARDTLYALVYDDAKKTSLARQASLLTTISTKLDRAREAAGKLDTLIGNADRARDEVTVLQAEKERLEKALEIDSSEVALRSCRADIEKHERALRSIESEKGTHRALMVQAQTMLDHKRTLLDTLPDRRANIDRLNHRFHLLTLLIEAYSQKGIPALLVERAVPMLEEIADRLLRDLSAGKMSLSIATQTETQTGKTREALNIVLRTERGTRLYETFSGGEKMRADLAVRIALAVLLGTRKGARSELLVLDETAAPLDAPGQEALVECLGRITDRFGLILVVSHLESLKDAFPARLDISKDATGSHIMLVQ